MKADKKFKNRSSGREFIRKQLMQDQYHLPRENHASPVNKLKTQTNSKFLNTLQFLDFNLIESAMLTKFQQKLQDELRITPFMIDLYLKEYTTDIKLHNLVKKLVNTGSESYIDDAQLIFQLKGIISTAKKIVQQIVNLIIFHHFIKINKHEYKTILRQFEQRQMGQIINQIGQQKSFLLTSKILSLILMIVIKYNELPKLFQLGALTIILRRKVQANFFNKEQLNVNHEYVKTTFFFSLKYTDSLLKQNKKSYQLMLRILNQLKIAKHYYDQGMINSEEYQLFVDELNKIKKMVAQNIQQDYYQQRRPIEQMGSINKITRTQSALKEFKLRRSFSKINKKNNFEEMFLREQNENILKHENEKIQANKNERSNKDKDFRFVYENQPLRKLKSFIKCRPNQSNLRKVRKDMKKSYNNSTFEKKQPTNNTKIIITTMQELAKQTFNFDIHRSKQEKDTMTLLSKLKSMTLLSMNGGKDKESEQMQKQEKKKKIQRIYSHFANQIKIIRDIPLRKLSQELSQLKKIQIGNKQFIQEMLSNQIVNFSAGLEDNINEFNLILNNKGCLELQFIKIWLNNLYICHVWLQIAENDFILRIEMNGRLNRILLHRGNNVLCQRYLTIWPTIRYLVYKKLIQFNLFKKYQNYLIIKKLAEVNLIELESQFYQQKFGYISKEEIEQINICLDNIFKLLLIIEHFYSRVIHNNRIQINKQYKYKLNINPQNCNGYHLKLNFLTEIFLNQYQEIVLCSFFYSHCENYFFVKVIIARNKLLKIINNKSDIQLVIEVMNLQNYGQSKTTVHLTWTQLKSSLIIYSNFVQFAIAICSKIKCNQNFTSQFIKYIAQRIVIQKNPILKHKVRQKVSFNFVVNQQYMANYKHSNIKVQSHVSVNYFGRFNLEIIEHYSSTNDIKFTQEVNISSNKDTKSKKLLLAQSTAKNYDLQNDQIIWNNENINNSCKEKNSQKTTHHKQKGNRRLIWQQERKLNNKPYLFLLYLIGQTISSEWIAEYILISRNNQAKHSFYLNHLDLLQIYTNKYEQENEETAPLNYRQNILKDKQWLLIDLINFLDFYCNHHISKIYILLNQKPYHHSYKKKNKSKNKHLHFNEIYNGNNNSFYQQPFLQQFLICNRLRIIKTVKIHNKFGLLTIKRNFIQEQPFWEVVLQFPRKHTQYIYQLSEQKMIFFISNSRDNQKTTKHRKRNCIFPLSPVHLSLSIQQSFNKQQGIDYKSKVLNLLGKGQIFITKKENQYCLNICDQQYILQERIIEYYDNQKGRLYNVWLDGQFIEVDMVSFYDDITDSVSLDSKSGFLKNSLKEVLGRMQLECANRFYEIQNKDTNEEDFYLTRVSQFFFQSCRHAITKQQRE